MNLAELKFLVATDIQKLIQKEYGMHEIQFLNPQFANQGDFSCALALKLGKQFGRNPLEVANEIAEGLNLSESGFIAKVEVLAPGFINFFVSEKFLIECLGNSRILPEAPAEPEHVVVDYSSPNIAKPLGIHHILTTVLGQAAVNLYRACGHKVTAWNYLGDWGTQFGKLIYAYKEWGDRERIERDPINELLKLYVEFHDKAETNDQLEDFGRAEFKKLEEGDEENRILWKWVVDISKLDIDKVYAKLGGINFDTYSGEADRENDLPVIIKEGVAQGIFVKGENGSLIVDLETEKMIPFLVQKSDGATLYSTRDIASVKTRIQEYEASKILYVVDVAQSLHFQQLFATVKKFDWFKESTELIHLKFGRMSFKDSKMSTRKGNIIHLNDLLDEAVVRAKAIIVEKNAELPDIDEVARIIGIGAVKYSILSQSPETNIVFEWDKIISFEGNAAPYLQYSYARANSILKQVENISVDSVEIEELSCEESKILKDFTKLEEVILDSCSKLKPHLLANYLFELSQSFNSFYANNPVLNCEDENRKNFRLQIVQKFCLITKTGLEILGGIEVPDKM